jgi:hypothetical protein
MSIYDKVEDKLPIVKERLAQLSFINDANLRYSNHEGYFNRMFGYAAGPSLSFDNLAHEMGHAIDCIVVNKPKRLTQDRWGLSITSYQDIMGERFYEPVTMQATELECRVVGYQKHILEMAGDPYAEEVISIMAKCLMEFMPDWYKGGKTKEEKIKIRTDLILNTYNSISKSDIIDIWSKVSHIIYGV